MERIKAIGKILAIYVVYYVLLTNVWGTIKSTKSYIYIYQTNENNGVPYA